MTLKKFTALLVCMILTVGATAQQQTGMANAINSQKVSAHLVRLTKQHLKAGSKDSSKRIYALATLGQRCDAKSFFERHECQLVDSIGRIYIIGVPLRAVPSLSNNDTVERIEAERMPRPAMDVTPGQVNATSVYSGSGLPQAYTGAGVAAGVFDSYYDFTHPAFRDAAGNLRIKYYYDFHWPNADSTLGHVIESTEEIEAQEHSLYTLNGVHGTHVTGIMAGAAVDGNYRGMAPEADIYLADFNSERAQFANPDEHTSAIAVLGFKYIFDRATADGKPCVINFSSCESVTLTRQRTLEGEALQALVGPGRIIVAGAGNDGTRACYLEKGADDQQAGTGIVNGLYGGGLIDIDLVTNGNQRVRFDFFGMGLSGGGIEGTIAFNTDSIDATTGNHFSTTVTFGDIDMDVTVSPQTDPRGTVYHIEATMPNLGYLFLCGAVVLLTSDNPAWMYSDIGFSPFENVADVPQYSFAQPGHSVSWPACLPDIIGVGATGYKSSITNIDGESNYDYVQFEPERDGLIAKFSSYGPTFDGRIKPDVVAPGMNINAPYNSFYTDFDGTRKYLTYRTTYGGKDYYYLAESGTSMSSPVVAGAIALWLQARPTLTPQEALTVISRTATHPDNRMEYPNNTYGYGQIDVYRGLLEVLQLPVSIPELSDHQPSDVIFRVENRRLYVDFGEKVPDRMSIHIYTIDGRKLMAQNGKTDIDLSRLPAGVYAVQLLTDSKSTTGSTLIRLQ